ncbi:hypothetical protein Tco_1147680 [Tanacetum coccineum]
MFFLPLPSFSPPPPRTCQGNKAYLADFQDFNGGPVAFGGSKGYITGKGKIKTGKLDFEDEFGSFNCKATSDESKQWLGGWVCNFKNLTDFVKGNLVRGLPTKLFQNDHTCVACQKGKQHKASCKAKDSDGITAMPELHNKNEFVREEQDLIEAAKDHA